MEKVVLQAQTRDVIGKQVRALRRQGLLPGVIYGHRLTPITVSLNAHEASMVLPRVSSSQLIDVVVDGVNHTVLVRERQRHPITSVMLHIDFQAVSMTEKLRITVSLNFKGEAPAAKTYNGIVMTSREQLEVECLPGDLPDHLDVDLTVLTEIGDTLHVRDIALPAGVIVLDDPDDVVVVVSAPVSEAAAAAAMGAVEPEVIERGKKEEDF
jgi:large subunit ribosomal protein L25